MVNAGFNFPVCAVVLQSARAGLRYPMKIKAIEMSGFKSFYRNTKITFSEGITAIVGPNGCGKSNILDAIRWVTGEHNPRSLRAGGMEDVISSGSSELKSLGMADVSLILEGVDALGFEEVVIRRKFYRSGESEYSINGVKCRLKDITEMLLDTGVGARAYSIVEQGQIESFITAKPEEKRRFIEEVAGIEKYKLRRKETLSRMESTRENLSRVLDLKREVSGRIEDLALQAERAKQYEDLSARSRSLEFDILSAKLADSNQKVEKLLEKKQQMEHRLAEADERREEKKSLLETAQKKNTDSSQGVSALQSEVYELRSQKRENEFSAASLEREIAGTEKYIKDIEGQVESLEREIEETENRRHSIRMRSGDVENARLTASEEILREEETLSALKQRWERSRAELDSIAEQISEVMTRRSSVGSTIGAFSGEVEDLSEKKASLGSQTEALATQKRERETELGTLLRREGEIKDRFTRASREKEETESRLYDLRVEREKKLGELRGFESRKKDCVSTREALGRIQDNYEWLPEATRKFVLEKKQSGVLGVVSDFVAVPRNYERAVEAAFGEKLNWIVVEGSNEAVAAVELLREFSAGRGTFIPVGGKLSAPGGPVAETDGPSRSLNSLLDVKIIGKDLVHSMLQEVYVASDLKEAVKLKKQNGNGACFATLEGDYIDSRGAITGGNSVEGVFERKRRIEELETEAEELSRNIKNSRGEYEKLSAEMESLQISRDDLSELLRRLEISSIENVKDRSNAETGIEDLGRRIESLESEYAAVEKKLNNKNRTMEEMHSLSAQLDRSRSTLDSQYEKIERSVLESGENVSSLQEKITDLRIKSASIAEREKALEYEMQETEKAKAVISEKFSLRKKDIELKKDECRRLRGSLVEAQNVIAGTARDLRTKQELLEKLERDASLFREQVRRTEEEFQRASGEALLLKEDLSSARSRYERAQDELGYLSERYRDVFGEKSEDSLPSVSSELSIPEAERELKRVRAHLENFGPVNLLAPEEYRQLEERNGFLENQTKDLLQSLESLELAIKKLDTESTARFREAFDAVDGRFRETFSKLFENGEARLELSDPDDLLETGVQVMIRPGGKKFLPINLLSGGEKALSAISVIISACLVKPVPFVFLDEIDAALDETNTVRFNKILKEISSLSQVAVITHNKKTMEEASTLVGITSNPKTASKVVTVKLSAA